MRKKPVFSLQAQSWKEKKLKSNVSVLCIELTLFYFQLGIKHISLLNAKKTAAVSLTEFVKVKDSSQELQSIPSTSKVISSDILRESTATAKEVLDAEILWALKCVQSHFSYNSCKDIGKVFSAMFPDSTIAQKFSVSESKCAYLCHFGLAPHFSMLLLKCLDEVTHYTLLFDEALNKTTQFKQLDILVRFWHPSEDVVRTQYLTSVSLGHSTANDMLKSFYSAVEKLDLSKLIQISMDGPAVNWKFYNTVQEDLFKEFGSHCINIGSCGLHILNNAFHKGESSTDWNVGSLLGALFYLFQDAPARKEDFLSCATSKKLPLKFCSHRWLENTQVAERAILIWNDVMLYIENVEKGKFGKVSCRSYAIVLEATKDTLILIKLNFFKSVAEILKPFLEKYQGDQPLLPFFAKDVLKLVKHIVTLFNLLKRDSLDILDSVSKLCSFDFAEKANHVMNSKLSLGFQADKLLKELLVYKKITDQEHFAIKSECKNFLVVLLSSIMDKCPINFLVVRNASCIDPNQMVGNKTKCINKMKSVLNFLAQKKKIAEKDCDLIKLQYSDFLDSVVKVNSIQFENFDSAKMRLDLFFAPFFTKGIYAELWSVLKMLLTLSHGQASVERGFSINKNIEIENRKEASYIAQRVIYDHIKMCDGILNVKISKELHISASNARSKYRCHLEELKKKEEVSAQKRKCEEELSYLQQKKICMLKDIEETEKLANELADNAESTKSINLFIKSNTLRKSLVEKRTELTSIEDLISAKKIL